MASQIKVDTVSEKTSANGVTIDGLNIKDAKLATANSVVETNMSANSVDSDSYVDGSIDTAHIADGQVTVGKLATAVFTGATDIGAAIVDADLFLMDDGAGGTIRKTTAARIKTYAGGGGGITAASMWRLTTSFTGDADPISSNLAVMSGDGYGSLGSAMTLSSGIFTFPSTGYWNIFAKFSFSNTASTEGRYNMGAIATTTDNSSYSTAMEAYDSSFESSSSSTTFGTTGSFIFDVTNTTNCKCKFQVAHEDTGTTTTGHGSKAYTHFIFTRLGDT